MAHRINWSSTSSKTSYNLKWKYGPKGVEYKNLAQSIYNTDKQKVVNTNLNSTLIIMSSILK